MWLRFCVHCCFRVSFVVVIPLLLHFVFVSFGRGLGGEERGGGERERARERENSNSQTLILKDIVPLASPCYTTTDTNKHNNNGHKQIL